MSIQVILQEDFPLLGYVGDMVQVKPGYARNFLIPRGLAVPAASTNGRLLKHKLEGIQAKRSKLKSQAQEFGQKLTAAQLEFKLKVGEGGKVFGAVTAKDIEAQLKLKGFDINKKQVRLQEPLRAQGEYRVEVKIHSEVSVSVPVAVALEHDKPQAQPSEEGSVKGGKERKPGKKRASKKDESAREEVSPETQE